MAGSMKGAGGGPRMSGRADGGPAAVRCMSESLESYSPVLDRDLEDFLIADLGDLDLHALDMPTCLERIATAAAHAAQLARLAVMLGGEHTASLGATAIPRHDYLARLSQVVDLPVQFV